MLSYATANAGFLHDMEGTPRIDQTNYLLSRCCPKSRMNLRLQEVLSECDAKSELHSPKDSNFQKSTSQSCRDIHAVCKNAQILSSVTK